MIACLSGLHVAAQQAWAPYKEGYLTVTRTGRWTTDTGPDVKPVRVATALTLDCCSTHAQAGQQLRQGYNMFLSWLNSVRGGLTIQGNPKPLELIMIDDRSDPKNVPAIVRQLYTEEQVDFFVGPSGSGLSEAMAAALEFEAAANDTVGVFPATSVTSVFQNRPSVFGVLPPAISYLTSTLVSLASRGATSVSALIEDSDEAHAMCAGLEDLAQTNGMVFAGSSTFLAGNYTVDDVVNQARHLLDASVVVTCVSEIFCDDLLQRTVVTYGQAMTVVTTQCTTKKSLTHQLGDMAQFVTGVTPWVATTNVVGHHGISTSGFADSYRSVYNDEPSYQSAAAWTALSVLVAAIEISNSLIPLSVANTLRKMDLNTIFGHFHANVNGQNSAGVFTVQYLSSATVPAVVVPFGQSTATLEYPMVPWSARQCINRTLNDPYGFRDGDVVPTCQPCAVGDAAIWTDHALGNRTGWRCESELPCSEACLYSSIQCAAGWVEDYNEPGQCAACPAGRYAPENSFQCIACPAGQYAPHEGSRECTPCPAGHDTGGTLASQHCFPCQPGTHASAPGTGTCAVCPDGTISLSTATECSDCQPGRSSDWQGDKCNDCAVGKYAIRSAMGSCADCPVGAICTTPGVSTPLNEVGWWSEPPDHQSDNGTDDISWWPCAGEEACLEDAMCPEGHTGLLCTVCLPGYAIRPHIPWKCVSCEMSPLPVIGFILMNVFFICLTYAVASLAISASGSVRCMASIQLKLLFNYSTTIGMVGWVYSKVLYERFAERAKETGDLPDDTIYWFVDIFRVSIVGLYGWFVPPCWLQPQLSEADSEVINMLSEPWYSEARSSVDYDAVATPLLEDFHWEYQKNVLAGWVIMRFVFVVMTPLAGLLPLAVHIRRNRSKYEDELGDSSLDADEAAPGVVRFLGIWEVLPLVSLLAQGRHQSRAQKIRAVASKLATDARPLWAVSFFMMYIEVTFALMQILDCTEFLDGSVSRMTASPDLVCLGALGQSSAYRGVVIFSVALVLALPLFIFFRIRTTPFHVYTMPSFQRGWGFFITGYEYDVRSWEALNLLRKVLSAMVVALPTATSIRILIFLVLAVVFTLLHMWYKPYDNRFNEALDMQEVRHLLVWLCFVLGAMLVHLVPSNSVGPVAWVVTLALLMMHVAYILKEASGMLRHGLNTFVIGAVKRSARRLGNDVVVEHLSSGTGGHAAQAAFQFKASMTTVFKDHARLDTLPTCVQLSLLDTHDTWTSKVARFCKTLHHGGEGVIEVNAKRMWFVLRSKAPATPDQWDQVEDPSRLSSLSQLLTKEDKPTEAQRRYFVKIVMEAFYYIIVTQGITTFSISLLEFIFGIAFAFETSGKLRQVQPKSSARGSVCDTPGREESDEKRNVKDCVDTMLDPSIYDSCMSLPTFHLNMMRLYSVSQEELQEWLDVFEVEWLKKRTQRLTRLYQERCAKDNVSEASSNDGTIPQARTSNERMEDRPVDEVAVAIDGTGGDSSSRGDNDADDERKCTAIINWNRLVWLLLDAFIDKYYTQPMKGAVARKRARLQSLPST